MSCLILGSEPVAEQDSPEKLSFLSACKFKILNSRFFSKNHNHGYSKELIDNFRFANDIYIYVSDSILFSCNYSERSALVRTKRDFWDIASLNGSISDSLNMIRWTRKAQLEEEGVVGLLARVLSIAAIAEKFMVGNCGEMAEVGLKYAYDRQVSQRVEIFEIKGGDHMFLVIGRSRWSDVNDPRTWGPGAVVCDPWAELVYPASELKERLMNYTGLDFDIESGRVFTKLEPFDPSRHSLSAYVEYPGH